MLKTTGTCQPGRQESEVSNSRLWKVIDLSFGFGGSNLTLDPAVLGSIVKPISLMIWAQ